MNLPREKMSELIDAYLDGEMSATDRATFEASVSRNPELAAELELQRRIDTRLEALFAPPPAAPSVRKAPEPNPIPLTKRRLPAWMKIAAALALLVLGAWAAVTRPWSYLLGPAPSDMAANVCFNELVKAGLKPIWKCDSEEVFRKYTRDQFGASFTVAPDPGVEVVGWTYASGLLDSTSQVLMCRVDGQPSIVVVGKKSDDRAMHVDAGAGVRMHRQERCGLVMYELNHRCDSPVIDRVRCE